MPQSAQKGARSKLADVLADIKNSRSDSLAQANSNGNNNGNSAPTSAKRRSAVNYVALSGHNPRQSRSTTTASLAAANLSTSTSVAASTNDTNDSPRQTRRSNSDNDTKGSNQSKPATQSPVKTRTFVLKLFDRSIDLAPFLSQNSNSSSGELGSLYAICRTWLQDHKRPVIQNNDNLKETHHDDRHQKHLSEQRSPNTTNKLEEEDERYKEEEHLASPGEPQLHIRNDELTALKMKYRTRAKKTREKIDQVANRLNTFVDISTRQDSLLT